MEEGAWWLLERGGRGKFPKSENQRQRDPASQTGFALCVPNVLRHIPPSLGNWSPEQTISTLKWGKRTRLNEEEKVASQS